MQQQMFGIWNSYVCCDTWLLVLYLKAHSMSLEKDSILRRRGRNLMEAAIRARESGRDFLPVVEASGEQQKDMELQPKEGTEMWKSKSARHLMTLPFIQYAVRGTSE